MSRLPLTKFVGFTMYVPSFNIDVKKSLSFKGCHRLTGADFESSILWGAICMCLAAPRNFAWFGALRFLLGMSEGAVSPAFVTIISMWYRKGEHASRVA